MRFLFINGPNVNMARFTEPGVEGEIDYNALLDYLDVCCQQMGIEPDFFQSNHEGDIIDEIQSAAGRADGIIINPGGYAYYSVAILEALQLCGAPAVCAANTGAGETASSCAVVSWKLPNRIFALILLPVIKVPSRPINGATKI